MTHYSCKSFLPVASKIVSLSSYRIDFLLSRSTSDFFAEKRVLTRSYELKIIRKPQINSAGLISGSYLTSLHGDRFFTLSLELNFEITMQLTDAVTRDPSEQK